MGAPFSLHPSRSAFRTGGMRIAVVGSGIAGLAAAWALDRHHHVDVFEADDRLGGHANTVTVDMASGPIAVDTGFVVFNHRTYPNFVRLIAELGVATAPSDMSFSLSVADGGLEYAGRLAGLLVQPRRLLSPRYLRMMTDIVRFRSVESLATTLDERATVADLVRAGGYSSGFVEDYLVPMTAAIWSARPQEILAFPAATMLRFLSNHGLIGLTDRPQWRTIVGGSTSYIQRLADRLHGNIYLSTPVKKVKRHPGMVEIRTAAGSGWYDQVVLAVHSDQALAILGGDADRAERSVLSRIPYQDNLAVLHTDRRLMPRSRRAWSSWNHMAGPERDGSQRVSVTYWMNRLQPLDTPDDLFVSLNPAIEPNQVHGRFSYAHPRFDAAALGAQHNLAHIQGRRGTWFAGAWCGYGFHEDGLNSGLTVARALGAHPPWELAADETESPGVWLEAVS